MYFLLLLLSCNSKWERPTRQSLHFIPSFLSALQPAKSQQLQITNLCHTPSGTFAQQGPYHSVEISPDWGLNPGPRTCPRCSTTELPGHLVLRGFDNY